MASLAVDHPHSNGNNPVTRHRHPFQCSTTTQSSTRWDENLLSTSKSPSDDFLVSPYELRIRESAQLKTVLELCDMEIHQKISMPDKKIESDGEEKHRSETQIAKL